MAETKLKEQGVEFEVLEFEKTASAINHIKIKNAAIGTAPRISVVGDDTDIDLSLVAKGAGEINSLADLYGNNNSLYGFEGVIVERTGTSVSILQSDNGKIIVTTNAATVTVTIPNTLPAGWNCLVIQKGAGQVQFVATASGNIRNRNGHDKIAGQYGVVTLFCESNAGTAPEVYLMGDTST